MDHALVVRGLERPRDLLADVKGLVDRQRAAAQTLGEILAVDVLQDQVPRALGFLDPVDARDVGVVERGQEPGLALEAGQAVGIARDLLGQDLDGHVPVQRGVAGQVHHPHPAAAHLAPDLVDADLSGKHRHAGTRLTTDAVRATPPPGRGSMARARGAPGGRAGSRTGGGRAPPPAPRSAARRTRRPPSRRATRRFGRLARNRSRGAVAC